MYSFCFVSVVVVIVVTGWMDWMDDQRHTMGDMYSNGWVVIRMRLQLTIVAAAEQKSKSRRRTK